MIRDILFVCTGNICRSPMAEGILKSRLDERDYSVSSAGTHAYEGLPASNKGILICRDEGIEIGDHSSRSVSGDLLNDADLVLVMERDHQIVIENSFPEFKNKVHLLREFGRAQNDVTGAEVDDPVGGDIETYRQCFDLLSEEIDRIIPILQNDESD